MRSDQRKIIPTIAQSAPAALEHRAGLHDLCSYFRIERASAAAIGFEIIETGRTTSLTHMLITLRDLRRLRRQHTDRLLTLLAGLLVLAIFVFAPLQALGVFVFQGFAIAALLAIIGGMLVISENPLALTVMAIGFFANVVVFLLRLFYPWPYNLHVLAIAWLAISLTLGVIVAQAVFRRGVVNYHRIVGAILLYLLVAVAFGSLYVLIGLSVSNAFEGITLEDNRALANTVFYLSFVTLTSTGFGDIVPIHPFARSLSNIESVIGQLYPATLLARLVTLELRQKAG